MPYLPPPSTLPPGSIVDSYRRDSGGMRQDKSTDQQLAALDAYCELYNLVHRNKFVDVAKSGGSTAGRDDFNNMMAVLEIPEHRPNGLLLWNHARFARDIDDAQLNKIKLRQWGLVIHSLNDQIPEGDYGRVIEFLIDVANEEKRKQTSVDAKRGLKELVEKFHCVPGIPPRGFKRTPVNLGPRRDKSDHIAHRWDPIPDFIPRIKQAFEMKAMGASHPQIHKATHIYGSLNSYNTFFENKLYIGILEYGDFVVKDYCEPMIDMKTWNAVQKIMSDHAQHRNHTTNSHLHPRRKNEESPYLLSGIAFCDKCKSPLWGMTSPQKDGGQYRRYACTRAKRNRDCDFQPVPALVLEKEVINKLGAFFENPDNIQALLDADQEHSANQAANNKHLVNSLQKQLKPIRKSIKNLAGTISRMGEKKSKALLKTLEDLEAQESALEGQLLSVKTEIPEEKTPLTAPEIAMLSKGLVARLHSRETSIIRRVLMITIAEVFVNRQAKYVFGNIKIKSPREPKSTKDEDSHARPRTVSISSASVGAPNKITFRWVVFLLKWSFCFFIYCS